MTNPASTSDIEDADIPEIALPFTDALARLLANAPEQEENHRLLKTGKLRVNLLTIAREADRSRTNYVNHPEILEALKNVLPENHPLRRKLENESPPEKAPRPVDPTKPWRDEVTRLTSELKQSRTKNAELLLYIRQLEQKLKTALNPVEKVQPIDLARAKRLIAKNREDARRKF
ncbi:hypothetical protein [Paraburkholderia sp. J76]|uniref:hypothetical protein n=1 Tax=Paraburkholderia sp. J76 TaxID=2805439 RepID=UPI002ABE50FD|nr:hypothetical protein [Paraburkholderia sp. J76]